MTLTAGARLGPYEIRSALGAGGMGEVYRARDTTLNRDVAIKVLAPAIAGDPDGPARFRREAQLLAALNHPNIAAIYGFESSDGVRALVMELVEGMTLADRIKLGAIPIGEALEIALQIVDALDAAHERGIIHRDLKPANIKITPDGAVKVLDFGLAKAIVGDAAGSDVSQSPTTIVPHTHQGVILGTLVYMSPEQVRGRVLDKRTDIWSFGCVLYEMLTARAAFSADTASDAIAAILQRDPDWRALPEATPPAIRRLLARCLHKDPRRRLRDVGDARVDLEDTSSESGDATDAGAGVRPHARERRLRIAVWTLGALLAASLAAVAILLRDGPPPDAQPLRRFSMMLTEVRPAISPDGRHIAYRSDGRLWVRDAASETPREIPGGAAKGDYYSESAYYLTWSPDSRDIVFPAGNELRRVSAFQGGSATTICTLPPGHMTGRQVAGLAWSRDGETIVFSRYGAGIYEAPARGGSPVLLLKEDHADDVALIDAPGGRAIAYATLSATGHSLVVQTPQGERRVIAELDTGWPELLYSPSGHFLYRRNPTARPSIWALPFSVRTLKSEGEAFVVERTGQGMSLSDDGTLVYLDVGGVKSQRLAWRDRAGALVAQSSYAHESIDTLSLSANGAQAIVVARDGETGIWLYDVQRFTRTRFELGREAAGRTVVTAFASRAADEIYFTTVSGVDMRVFVKPVEGSGETRAVPLPFEFNVAIDNSADGKYLLIVAGRSRNDNFNLWLWRKPAAGGAGDTIHFSQNTENELVAVLSPNGRYVAYTSTISGRVEVYVRPFPDGRGRWQVSSNGGEAPRWGPDGKELFFKEGNTLMRSSVSTTGEFSAGSAEALFDHQTLRVEPAPGARYGISRDGQRFLTVESERELAAPVVRLVENWLSEFGRTAGKSR